MTTPTAPASTVTVSTDKTSYQPGDPIQVTVEYTDPDNPGTTLTVTATVTNNDGTTTTGEVDVQVGGSAAAPMPVSVTDSFGGAYTQQSNDAGTAVFTGTVGTPPGWRVILQIDVEVVGPGQVMTGSTAVEVVVPEESQSERPVTDADLANLRLRQRSQALRWGGR